MEQLKRILTSPKLITLLKYGAVYAAGAYGGPAAQELAVELIAVLFGG